ncbi:MAG: hypothetical protein IT181_25075 [Acidobacteria bacterium]|nr:hypothetical protein [Acidobacteriota bacterium]
MKKLIAVALTAVVTVACANQKAPAEMALKGLESAMAAAQPEIEKFAGDQLAGVTGAVAATRKKFEAGDYPGVLNDVPTVTARISEMATAAAAKKADLVTEWGTMASLPATVAQITAKVTELSAMKRLPAGLDKGVVEGAQTSLASVTSLWSDASASFEKGDLVNAVAKAKDVQTMATTLMTSLGMAGAAAK